MKSQTAYCSACDRDVQVIMPEELLHDAQAPVGDPEIVCLEIGTKCTGALCPVGAVPPTVMMVRRVRSGIHPVLEPTVTARCEICASVTDHVIVSASHATCAECGTTVSRKELDLVFGRDE